MKLKNRPVELFKVLISKQNKQKNVFGGHFPTEYNGVTDYKAKTQKVSKTNSCFSRSYIIKTGRGGICDSIPSWFRLNLFRIVFFEAAHGWVAKMLPLSNINYTGPAMMKLGTVTPYLKKIQKLYESRDAPL